MAAGVAPESHYWDGQAAIAYPPSPGDGWVFDFAVLAWTPDARALWTQVRLQRDKLLAACDWRALADSPAPENERAQWHAYRQALRDITDQPDPLAIVWSQPPA